MLASFFISAGQEEEIEACICKNTRRKMLLQWIIVISASQSFFATNSMHVSSRTTHVYIYICIYVQTHTHFYIYTRENTYL